MVILTIKSFHLQSIQFYELEADLSTPAVLKEWRVLGFGKHLELPPTEQTTLWFNRVLNVIHAHAPAARIILVRGDALPAISRVLE